MLSPAEPYRVWGPGLYTCHERQLSIMATLQGSSRTCFIAEKLGSREVKQLAQVWACGGNQVRLNFKWLGSYSTGCRCHHNHQGSACQSFGKCLSKQPRPGPGPEVLVRCTHLCPTVSAERWALNLTTNRLAQGLPGGSEEVEFSPLLVGSYYFALKNHLLPFWTAP